MTHGKTMGTAKPAWLPAEADGHRAKHDIEFYRALDQASPRGAEGANWESWRPDRDFMPFAPISGQAAAGIPDLEPSFQVDSVPWGKPAADKVPKRPPVPASDLRRAFAPVVFATAFALSLLNHGAIADKAMQFQGRTVVASAEPIPDAPFSLSGAWRRLPVLPGPQAKPVLLPAAEPSADPDVQEPDESAAPASAPVAAPLQPGAARGEPAGDDRGALDRHFVPIALDAICDIPVIEQAVVQTPAGPLIHRQVISEAPAFAMPPKSAAIETAALVTQPTVHRTPPPLVEPTPPASSAARPSLSKTVLRGGDDAAPSAAANRAKHKASARRTPVTPGQRSVDFAADYAGNFGPSTKGFESIRRASP